mmetsp:Transcript_16062/g.34802  ORF Transcript_16062/g.34802 Transcript_16062/m.34802 type:complete len:213 (-) Transcript_16062:946-1584(-)
MLKLVMLSVAAAMSVPSQSPSTQTPSPLALVVAVDVVVVAVVVVAIVAVTVSFRGGRSTMVAAPAAVVLAWVLLLLLLLLSLCVTPLLTLAKRPPAKLLALSMASFSCLFLSLLSEAGVALAAALASLSWPSSLPSEDRSLARWIFRSRLVLYLRRRRPSMDRNSSTVLGPAPSKSSRTRFSVRSRMVEKSKTVTLSLASAMPSLALVFCAK